MTTSHRLHARLAARPAPTATSMNWTLWWELSVDEGIAAAGPAGIACADLGVGTGWGDYADPDRLLQVDLPAGTVRSAADDDALARAADVGDAALELASAVFGPGAADALAQATAAEWDLAVEPRPQWSTVGRLALAEQVLADRGQPVTGLWAVQVADLLRQIGAPTACDERIRQLVELARPALDLLPGDLAEQARPGLLPLEQALLGLARATGEDLGPFAAASRARGAHDALTDLEDLAEQWRAILGGAPLEEPPLVRERALVHRSASTTRSTRAAERGTGDRGGAPEPVEQPVLVDESARRIVDGGACRSVPGSGTLQVLLTLPRPELALLGAVRRIQVLAAVDGDLVAVAAGLRAHGRQLRAELTVPTDIDLTRLVVVVGRNLPMAAMDRTVVEDRTAIRAGRILADRLRRTRASEADLRAQATELWAASGRPDLAEEARMAEAAAPFAVELAAGAIFLEEHLAHLGADDGAGAPDLVGARDLAWSLGDLRRAALLELRRLQSGDGELELLPLASHDALTLALAFGDDPALRDAAAELDAFTA